MSIYSFHADLSNGSEISLKEFKGNVLLVVNTASQCGLTPQYEGLEKLYQTYKDDGLKVLGFPCNQFGGQEPGTDEEIRNFCSVNYNVTFPLFQKIEVNGERAHPLYTYLKQQAPIDSNFKVSSNEYQESAKDSSDSSIQWNFTKFLLDREGNVVKRFSPDTKPEDIEEDIKKLL
ncbi:glutathione peroxidase [Bacillus oleivorans]|uniref:Glutathione peroxidase n=1 Tax=Bacillus oleivorans TaxID=1448271 RepID=A0A285CLR6_9BACI|nr:glutathione peroxidase [Bacillus oleivorans]SNX68491.1 glutathione peroxidase [Bacillus oleivorans]